MGCGASSAAPATEAKPETAVATVSPPSVTAATAAPTARAALYKQVFAAMDTDADGAVDLSEFKKTAKSAVEADMELPMMYNFLDANGDGKLSYEEWVTGMESVGFTDDAFEKEMKDVLQVLEGAKMAVAESGLRGSPLGEPGVAPEEDQGGGEPADDLDDLGDLDDMAEERDPVFEKCAPRRLPFVCDAPRLLFHPLTKRARSAPSAWMHRQGNLRPARRRRLRDTFQVRAQGGTPRGRGGQGFPRR